MRNPAWNRDELILALELYFREPTARGSKSHPEVFRLSNLLNSLPIHPDSSGKTFRNPNGVGMKLSNFLKYDPNYEGKGLERGSILEEEIWNEFASDLTKLEQTASAIVKNYKALNGSPPAVEDEDDSEATEGKVLTRVHKMRERNQAIVCKKKQKVLDNTGTLSCEACNFDFSETYGELGVGFAECHHEVPVAELEPGQKTKLSDLRILCANCHRMIHRAKPWLTFDGLKALLEERGKNIAHGP